MTFLVNVLIIVLIAYTIIYIFKLDRTLSWGVYSYALAIPLVMVIYVLATRLPLLPAETDSSYFDDFIGDAFVVLIGININ